MAVRTCMGSGVHPTAAESARGHTTVTSWSAAGVGIVDAVAAGDRVPLAVATAGARRHMARGLDVEVIAAVRAAVGAGRDVAACGDGISHRDQLLQRWADTFPVCFPPSTRR